MTWVIKDVKVKINFHQTLEFLDNLQVASTGYSSDESSLYDFISIANFVLVPRKDNDRETVEDLASEGDPNPSCLNKYQLLTEVNLNIKGGNATLNDTSFSQVSIGKSSSSSNKRKQPSNVSPEAIVYGISMFVCGTS